ncbi:MAG: hypothetical protein QF752_04565 [Planctomycetota bacterium]|jgi:uncharacterized coiled-coil protein SlyX|nr:hypothetical protein [Planctomycetota bacterium]
MGLFLMILIGLPLSAQSSQERRISDLESQVSKLLGELDRIKKGQAENRAADKDQSEQLDKLLDRMSKSSSGHSAGHWTNRFTFGGYGDMHYNFEETAGNDKADIHRWVLQIDYEFADWIHFVSETEIEHAFIADNDGELYIEQFYIQLDFNKYVKGRVGRVLTPLGIINQNHEPTSFHGVERPSFASRIIPTTWVTDGIGFLGQITPWLTYETYVGNSIDGSLIDDNGIRSARMKERPSLHEVAWMGRIDVFPLVAAQTSGDQTLRLGFSTYFGGLDNGNNGNNPGVDGDIRIFCADFDYKVGKFAFRGELAYEELDHQQPPSSGVAKGIFGWYLEGAYFWFPEAWKTGRLAMSDASIFLRFDDFDTQYEMPKNLNANHARNRQEWTFGINFWLTPQLVFKTDVQIPSNGIEADQNTKFNLGFGFHF